MNKKTVKQKGKSFKLPVQQLSGKSIQSKADAFFTKDKNQPKALVLQFEIDLNSISRNKYYLIGYLKSGRGKNTKFSKKISIPLAKAPETKLSLPKDLLAFGNIEIPYNRLKKILAKNDNLIFTPILYPNPHVAYDINGEELYPSPPAPPNYG
jgi:hypothetical protein